MVKVRVFRFNIHVVYVIQCAVIIHVTSDRAFTQHCNESQSIKMTT